MPTTKQSLQHASLTIPQLLQGSAWFPLLDVAAGERVLDEMREVEVGPAPRCAGAATRRRTGTARSKGCSSGRSPRATGAR